MTASPLPERTLVRHLRSQAAATVDTATRERLAQALLDWFTAGWSGAAMPLAAAYRQLGRDAFDAPAPGTGVPLFGGGRAGVQAAAFTNAALAHLREIDDAHRAAMLHPGVVAITPVLARAAAAGWTRRQVRQGIVAGYEVALRLGECLGPRHAGAFHGTATAGAVGAAAAVAVAEGLDEDRLHHALGHAATQSAGLWQLVDDGAHEAKSLHPGFAVRNGLMATAAARAGLPAAQAFVTGPRGLYALLAGDGPLAALHEGLDAPARLHTATIKAWPSCAMTFTALDALEALRREHGLRAADVAAVDVRIFRHALKIASVDWPTKPVEAAFSLRYLLAALLHHGQVGIAQTETPALDDPALLALAQRVRVQGDDGFQQAFPARRPAEVTVRLHDGRCLSATRELRRGDPEDPFDWTGLVARLRAFAPTVDDAAQRRLTAWCEAFLDPALDDAPCPVDAGLFSRPDASSPPAAG